MPKIYADDIPQAVKNMKKGKVSEKELITSKILQKREKGILIKLKKFFNCCLDKNNISERWKNALIILI